MALEDTAVLLPSGQHLRRHMVPEFDVDLAHLACAGFIVDTSELLTWTLPPVDPTTPSAILHERGCGSGLRKEVRGPKDAAAVERICRLPGSDQGKRLIIRSNHSDFGARKRLEARF